MMASSPDRVADLTGTLVMLALVVLNRRATLTQINSSLADISRQFRELKA